MARKTDPAKMDDAVRLYLAGKSAAKAAAIVGVSKSALHRALKARDLVRGQRGLRLPPDTVDAYQRGESVLSISRRLGMSRSVVVRHLREAGVETRGTSEQNRLSAAAESGDQRRRRVKAAHAARRGSRSSDQALAEAAKTREALALPESEGERQMLAWLSERGENGRPQVAVCQYNIDIAIDPVAVEVLGGEWHRYKPVHEERTKALLDAGWHVLFVWNTLPFPLMQSAADYAVTFAKTMRLNPPRWGEYRVIRGDGEFIAAGSAENYDLTLIPAARHGMSPSEVGRLGAKARWG